MAIDKTLKDFIFGNQNQEFQNTANQVPTADRTGLPSSKIIAEKPYTNEGARNLIHFFLPQVGVVKMYINPQAINYGFSKIITSTQTKGGFSNQYWGEKLPTLKIAGNTGSSGVEGINVLYEVYRSEQYAFDSAGLSIAEQNYNSPLQATVQNIINTAEQPLTAGNILGAVAGITNVSTGVNTTTSIPDPASLASLAFGVEIYYSGWVFRGYFESFDFSESSTDFLYNYNINFVVTQRRGYRTNYFPWHKNPNSESGEAQYSFEDDRILYKKSNLSPLLNDKVIKTVTQLQKNVTGR